MNQCVSFPLQDERIYKRKHRAISMVSGLNKETLTDLTANGSTKDTASLLSNSFFHVFKNTCNGLNLQVGISIKVNAT